ncbi:MAG TPA: hypothetical protein ENH41_05350 [Candidatus Omnitrophica bacterium]|nr:hypothetical protein [Candidatus Omnitrophota bacterium]
MVRTIDYKKRKKDVLAATVDYYIHNAIAASSETLALSFNYSSATIRNVMAELEEEGLLTHTHTSSGRIPTDRGYRFYVDNLLLEIKLLQSDKDRVFKEYRDTKKELDVLLEKTSYLISSLTHCTGIVSFVRLQNKIFYKGVGLILDYPEFKDFTRIKVLMNLLERKHRLLEVINRNLDEKLKIYIGRELPFEEVTDCTLIVSHYSINHKPQGCIAVLGPTRMEYARVIPAIEYISESLSAILSKF